MLNDTIVAIATASSDSAISIVKLSGSDAITLVDGIFTRDLTKAASHTIHYGIIKDKDEVYDEVLVSVFRSPRTFTKEDIIEINCHGGVYITRKILALCISKGARLAMPGEFTKRAYLNGRIDLAQAEATNDMINAKSENQAILAISGIKGNVNKLIDPLMEELMNIIAHIEVNIDYPEYDDVVVMSNEILIPLCNKWLKEMDNILRKASLTRRLKEGVKTAIVGKPNVGKSSLLNALLDEDKAIVTDVAGTTRDLVEGIVQLNHVTLHLIDTAGIRDTSDVVEKIGIEKSKEAINQAELCILVFDGTKDLDYYDQELLELTKDKQRIIVYNKNDINKIDNEITISALNNDIDELIDKLNEMYKEDYEMIDQPSLNNERQVACLMSAKNEMELALQAIQNEYELDLVTINLQEAYNNLKDILGQRSREDLIDTLFSKFCLGK